MKPHAYLIAFSGLLFLFTVFSGVWMSRNLMLNDPRPSGQPIAGAISTAHKLLAIAMAICAGLAIRRMHRGTEFTSIEFTAVIVAALLFVLMVVSGSLLSLGKPRNEEIAAIHKIGWLMTGIPTFGVIYLLARGG